LRRTGLDDRHEEVPEQESGIRRHLGGLLVERSVEWSAVVNH
jgi:hypothetical protein